MFLATLRLPWFLWLSTGAGSDTAFDARVRHGFVNHDGVKIHYAELGRGPLIVMLHGFPDFWYTWRNQMVALAPEYRVVAIDQRGYNLSDKPKGVEQYDLSLLASDLAAVIQQLGAHSATIVGHDWGGAVAWYFAQRYPELTDRLIILNLPHLRGLVRELAHNPVQRRNSQYARAFQQEGAAGRLTAEALAGWVTDSAAKTRYVEAFRRSDFEAMLNYYKRNYPREPYTEDTSAVVKVKAPVLMIHGLKDQYLLAGALGGTWDWVENGLTLVTVPSADHFVQQDAPDLVNRTIQSWLALHPVPVRH